MPLEDQSDEHTSRLTSAITEAILNASIIDHPSGGKMAHLRSGEIVRAMTNVMAFFVSTSEQFATPKGTREFIEQVGADLKKGIAVARRENSAAKAGLVTMQDPRGPAN